MAEQTLQQQLAAALQQLSKQHEKQLQSVLEQVQSLSKQVIALTDTSGSGSQSSNPNSNPRLAELMITVKQSHGQAQCVDCKHAHWRMAGRKIEFNCLNNMRIELPTPACNQFEIL